MCGCSCPCLALLLCILAVFCISPPQIPLCDRLPLAIVLVENPFDSLAAALTLAEEAAVSQGSGASGEGSPLHTAASHSMPLTGVALLRGGADPTVKVCAKARTLLSPPPRCEHSLPLVPSFTVSVSTPSILIRRLGAPRGGGRGPFHSALRKSQHALARVRVGYLWDARTRRLPDRRAHAHRHTAAQPLPAFSKRTLCTLRAV